MAATTLDVEFKKYYSLLNTDKKISDKNAESFCTG